jgi:hypothetical protein
VRTPLVRLTQGGSSRRLASSPSCNSCNHGLPCCTFTCDVYTGPPPWPVMLGDAHPSPLHLLCPIPVRLCPRVPLDVAADAGSGGRHSLPCQQGIQGRTQVLACRRPSMDTPERVSQHCGHVKTITVSPCSMCRYTVFAACERAHLSEMRNGPTPGRPPNGSNTGMLQQGGWLAAGTAVAFTTISRHMLYSHMTAAAAAAAAHTLTKRLMWVPA